MLLICAFSYIQYTKQQMQSVKYNTIQTIKYSLWYQLIHVSAPEYHHQEVYSNKGPQEQHAAYSCVGPIEFLLCVLIVVNNCRLLTICAKFMLLILCTFGIHLCSFVLINSMKMAPQCRKMMELMLTMKHVL
jgi:hypothetical protein